MNSLKKKSEMMVSTIRDEGLAAKMETVLGVDMKSKLLEIYEEMVTKLKISSRQGCLISDGLIGWTSP